MIARYIHKFLAGTDWSFDEIGVYDLFADSAAGFRGYLEKSDAANKITVNPDGALVWIGSNREKTVSVFDPESGTIVATLDGFGFPYRMAVTPDSRTAVLSDPASGEIRIVDVATREERHRIAVPKDGVLPSAEIPESPAPEGIALSRDNRMAYVSLQGKNQAAAVDLESGSIVAVFATGGWPDGIGYSPLTR